MALLPGPCASHCFNVKKTVVIPKGPDPPLGWTCPFYFRISLNGERSSDLTGRSSMSNRTPLISLRGQTYRYEKAGRPALRDVSLDIPEGAFFGLLGPNGAGKSTMIGLLTGVLKSQQGEIELRQDASGAAASAERLRRASGYAPQDLAFYPALSVRENLDFFSGAYGLSGRAMRAACDRAIGECRLDDVLDRRSGSLSGGQQRRLNLAIALLPASRVLYLDEPTVGIDAQSRRTILDAIASRNREGVTIVYTSHYMEEVETLCDAVAIINFGRVIACADMADLLARAAERTARIRLVRPAAEQAAAGLAERHAIVFRSSRDLEIPVRTSDQLARCLDTLRDAGCNIESVSFGAGRLNDIYLELIEHSEAA